jgi:hypothetical protein
MEKSRGASEPWPPTMMFSRSILTLIMVTSLAASFNAELTDEYHVKAAYLYNFTKFIVWPPDAFRDSDKTFQICVLGRDPFGTALDEVVAGKVIEGRPFEVRRLSDRQQTGSCRILYAAAPERKRNTSIPLATSQIGLLTVDEAGSGTSDKAIVNFTLEHGKVRFEINITAAEESKLQISSRLLNLATVVKK